VDDVNAQLLKKKSDGNENDDMMKPSSEEESTDVDRKMLLLRQKQLQLLNSMNLNLNKNNKNSSNINDINNNGGAFIRQTMMTQPASSPAALNNTDIAYAAKNGAFNNGRNNIAAKSNATNKMIPISDDDKDTQLLQRQRLLLQSMKQQDGAALRARQQQQLRQLQQMEQMKQLQLLKLQHQLQLRHRLQWQQQQQQKFMMQQKQRKQQSVVVEKGIDGDDRKGIMNGLMQLNDANTLTASTREALLQDPAYYRRFQQQQQQQSREGANNVYVNVVGETVKSTKNARAA
jgi:hypothetical protein